MPALRTLFEVYGPKVITVKRPNLCFVLVGVDTGILESFGIQRLYDIQWLTDKDLLQIWNVFIGYTGTPNHMILEGRPSGVKLVFKYTTSQQTAQVSYIL